MENLWLISIVALLIGGVIGYLLGRNGGNDSQQEELQEELLQARQELENYREEVTEHFSQTANLFNNLTDSYKDVYQHLAGGAQQLCQSEEIARSLESTIKPQLTSGTTGEDDPDFEPPRDYAPKGPDDEGTLSETFGLTEAEKRAKAEAENG